MEHQKSCTLRVNVSCCTPCRAKAREKVEKTNGVSSVIYDETKGMMIVSGDVNPLVLVEKLARWDDKAQLVSSKDDPIPRNKQSTPEDGKAAHMNPFNGCDALTTDDEDYDHDQGKTEAAKARVIIAWKHPELETKKSKKGKKSSGGGSSKWQFPLKTTPEKGVRLPPPPSYPPISPYHPYYGPTRMRPLPPSWPRMVAPPPYGGGFFQPWPLRETNPMVQYTSYADNYPWKPFVKH